METDCTLADNHRLQWSGEADVFEVVNQHSPPAEPGRYPTKRTLHHNSQPLTFQPIVRNTI